MDLNISRRAEILTSVAQDWRQPEHPPRESAVHDLIHGENTFTAEATAFALNQLMASVTPDALRDIAEAADAGTESPRDERGVLLEHSDQTPTSGVRELWVLAHLGVSTHSIVPANTPALIPTIVRSMRHALDDAGLNWEASVTNLPEAAELESAQSPPKDIFPSGVDVPSCQLALTEGSGPIFDAIARESSSAAGVQHLPRSETQTIGVIDGSEPEEDRQRLAEDALLHEGASPRSLKILWAPRDLSPDPMLEAMAEFRGVFPAHDATPGALEMQRAFLEATDQSHAYAAGLQFLVSRGKPEAREGAHVRWVEYDAVDEVVDWWADSPQEIQRLVARRSLQERVEPLLKEKGISADVDLVDPGEVHRPPLATPRVRALLHHISGAASDSVSGGSSNPRNGCGD